MASEETRRINESLAQLAKRLRVLETRSTPSGASVDELSELLDVDILTNPPDDGNALVYDATAGKWIAGAGADLSQYLRLDASNDPVTTDLDINGVVVGNGGVDLTNTVVGRSALQNIGAGTGNTAVGAFALNGGPHPDEDNISNNTSVGHAASTADVGSYNTSVGAKAGFAGIATYRNVTVGSEAGTSRETGSDNVEIGANASTTDGNSAPVVDLSSSVIIGSSAGPEASGDTNEVVIGALAIGNGSNTVTLGNDAVTEVVTSGTFVTEVAPGTPPFATGSQEWVENFNADLLDGHHYDEFALSADLDNTYLRLDGSNDPVTGNVDIVVTDTNAFRVLATEGTPGEHLFISASQRFTMTVTGDAEEIETFEFSGFDNAMEFHGAVIEIVSNTTGGAFSRTYPFSHDGTGEFWGMTSHTLDCTPGDTNLVCSEVDATTLGLHDFWTDQSRFFNGDPTGGFFTLRTWMLSGSITFDISVIYFGEESPEVESFRVDTVIDQIHARRAVFNETSVAPLTVNSQTVVENLNSDLLDGHHWEEIEGFSDPSRYICAYNYMISASYNNYRIGFAQSPDLRTWTIVAEPIINIGSAGSWEDDSVKDPWLVKDKHGKLFCYYSGYDGSLFKIGVATSVDGGTTWVKSGSNPILSPTVAWEGTSIRRPVVFYDPDDSPIWRMWYINDSTGQLGYATSSDGVSWTKYASNPIHSSFLPQGVSKRGDEWIFWGNGIGYRLADNPEGPLSDAVTLWSSDSIWNDLTAGISLGDTLIAVTSSQDYVVGMPIWVKDSSGHFLTTVASIPDSTHIEMSDPAPVGVASDGEVRSTGYQQGGTSSVVFDDGWIHAVSVMIPFNDGGVNLKETTLLAYMTEDLSVAKIDYAAGLMIPISLAESMNGQVSRENPVIVLNHPSDLRKTPTVSSMSFNDAEGDPEDVIVTTPADGTSEFPARRDHVHSLGDVTIDDLSDVSATDPIEGDIIYFNGVNWEKFSLGVSIALSADSRYIELGDIAGRNIVQINRQTGNLKLLGTARTTRDDVGDIFILKVTGTRITIDSSESTMLFADNCAIATDWAAKNVQLNHDRDATETIHPHIHWFQASANVPNWLIQYRWHKNGSAKTTSWTNLGPSGQVFTYTSGTILQITGFDPITPPTGSDLSDIVQFRILRDCNNSSGEFSGADPLTGNASLLMFDVHMVVDGFGSDEEYEKEGSTAFLTETGDYLSSEDGDSIIL